MKTANSVMRIDNLRGKKTLIIGEINTGKTTLTKRILELFLAAGEEDIAIIDMAPERIKNVGGKMRVGYSTPVRYYTTRIVPPRLTGKSDEEVERLARENATLLDGIMETYLKNPARLLIINDVSIYLQAGKLETLLELINSTPTVVMNGYYGNSLGGGKLGERERQKMKFLQGLIDHIILLETNHHG